MSAVEQVRILVAPCGCASGADSTNDTPGFCRSKSEAAEDTRRGFTERVITFGEFRDTVDLTCTHNPRRGVA